MFKKSASNLVRTNTTFRLVQSSHRLSTSVQQLTIFVVQCSRISPAMLSKSHTEKESWRHSSLMLRKTSLYYLKPVLAYDFSATSCVQLCSDVFLWFAEFSNRARCSPSVLFFTPPKRTSIKQCLCCNAVFRSPIKHQTFQLLLSKTRNESTVVSSISQGETMKYKPWSILHTTNFLDKLLHPYITDLWSIRRDPISVGQKILLPLLRRWWSSQYKR